MAKEITVDGERGGYTVRRTRTGHVVEMWSRIRGDWTGRRVLVPFRDRVVDPNLNLAHVINDHGTTEAEVLIERAKGGMGRVIRRGHKVE